MMWKGKKMPPEEKTKDDRRVDEMAAGGKTEAGKDARRLLAALDKYKSGRGEDEKLPPLKHTDAKE
jgi:hypothetical protein